MNNRQSTSSRRLLPHVGRLLTSDEEEVARRRERARTEKFVITNTEPAEPVFSNFEVQSASGMRYEVEIRDVAWRQVFCTCTDFRVNRLGTCKHVEAVFDWLEKNHAKALEEAMESGSQRVDIIPDTDGERLCVERNLDRLPASLRAYVDEEGVQRRADSEAFAEAVEKLKNPAVRLTGEARAWLARRAAQREKVELRRRYEQEVRSGFAPLSETLQPLYPFQREGMLHLAFNERAMLADDFGLGRSLQAIAACALLAREEKARRVLVVSPRSLRSEWEEQIRSHTVLSLATLPTLPSAHRAYFARAAFFTLATYEQAAAVVGELNEEFRPDVVILDEAQRIADWNDPQALSIKRLKSRFAFVLADDLPWARLDAVYSIVSFLDPEVVGPLFRFNREFYELDESGRAIGVRNIEKLRERIRPLVLRRTQAEVASQLPPVNRRVYRVEPTTAQKNMIYSHMREAEALRGSGEMRLKGTARTRLMQYLCEARMACDSPRLLDSSASKGPKMEELFRILQESSGKVVVFSEWDGMIGLLKSGMDSAGMTFADGNTRAGRERFDDEDACRVLLSTDATWQGWRPASCDLLVHFDIPWTARQMERRLDRVRRPDARQNLNEVFLVAADTIEDRLLRKHLRVPQEKKPRKPVGDGLGDLMRGPRKVSGPVLRELSLEEKNVCEKLAGEAARRVRVATLLQAEGFTEDAVASLRQAFLNIARMLAKRYGLPDPESSEVLCQEPMTSLLDEHALTVWRWHQSPAEELAAGLRVAADLLSR